jgi:hypothetical protein
MAVRHAAKKVKRKKFALHDLSGIPREITMAKRKKSVKKATAKTKVAKKSGPKSTKTRKRGVEFGMFADSPERPDIPVFVEFVVDVPRAVIRGNWMIDEGHAVNVWIMQTIEHLT